MKIIYITSILSLISTSSYAQELDWAFNLGQVTYSAGGRSIAADNNANIFTIGNFGGVVDFDPSANTVNLGMGSTNSSFILKTNPQGETVWAGSFQSNVSGGNGGIDIAIDHDNRIISTGTFRGITDFDPGTGTENIDALTTGSNRTYISILDNDGAFVWAGALLGGKVDPTGIGVDASGNIFLTGNFDGTVDFDPGVGTSTLTSATTSVLNDAFFVLKLTPTGDFVWAQSIDGYVESTDLAVDSNGDVWVTGIFEATADFDPGVGVNSKTALGDTDGFTLKLNGSDGSASFLSVLGGYNADKANGITIHNNIVYTIGSVYQETPFSNQLDLDPSGATNYITGFPSASAPLGFIQKLELNGDFNSAIALTDNAANPKSIAINANNEIYVTGSNLYHLFERKIDVVGTIIWNHSIVPNASNLYNEGRGVVVTSNSVAFTGVFWRFGDFDPSPTTELTLTCDAFASHIYVQKLNDNTASLDKFKLKNLSVYPNPSTGIFNVKSEVQIQQIDLYSNTGTQLFTLKTFTNQIDLSNYPTGIYFIKVTAMDDSETTVRIIKD